MQSCTNCEGDLHEEDYRLDKNGEAHCSDCYSSAYEHASTLKAFGPDGNETYRFDELFNFDDDDFGTLSGVVEGVRWVQTDGWRGYTSIKFQDDVEVIASGWLTGYPDSTTSHKLTAAQLYDKLEREELVPPVPLYWVFSPTSNVFSVASDMVVHKDDKPKLEQWLETTGTTLGDLKEAFN